MYKRATRIERLARKEEKATVKRITYLSIISLILAVFLFTMGVPLLGKFADLLDSVSKNTESQDESAPQPPNLDELPTATSSAKLKVTGFSQGADKVEIFLEDEPQGSTKVENGKFFFEDLTLRKGENKLFVKAVGSNGKESDASDTQTIIYDNEEPKLEISTPTEGQSFSGDNRVRVSGKTDKDAQVFAAGFLASVNSEGDFEVFVPMAEGENNIEIKALDSAGNQKVEKRKVTYKK